MLSSVFSQILRFQYKRLLSDQANPLRAQEKAFKKLKASLRGTAVSRSTLLSNIENYSDFLKMVKPTTYTDHGEKFQSILNEAYSSEYFLDELKFVGLSSGTTGARSKVILFNEGMLRSFKSYQLAVASILENRTQVRLFRDKRLTWGSSAQIEFTTNGIPCGYVSGFLSTRSPKFAHKKSFPKISTALLSDMDQKIQQTAKEVFSEDIRLLSGVPSYLISLLESLKEKWGIQNFSEVWPNLNTILYSATPIGPYRETLEALMGRPLQFIGLYVATEGPIGYEIPSTSNETGIYSFHFGDTVYGFRNLETKQIMGIHELQAGDEVELLTSSANGLLQYSMGDCLRIRSVNPTITFEVIGRIGQGMNMAAEKVSLSELQNAVQNASSQIQTPIRHYFVHPGKSARGKACYEWTVLLDNPDSVNLSDAIHALDESLMKLNEDYHEARNDTHFLDAPVVHLMNADYLKDYFKRESHRGQLKVKTAFESEEKFHEFLEVFTGQKQSMAQSA